MAPQFTDSVAEALQSAFMAAENNKHTEVTENHLLVSLLENPEGYFSFLIRSLQMDPDRLLEESKKKTGTTPTFASQTQPPVFSKDLQDRIREADTVSKSWGDSYISADHLFFVFWKSAKDPFALWKKSSSWNIQQIEDHIKKLRGGSTMDSSSSEQSLQTLEKYCKNLTLLAKQGKLDPVIGRDEEIRRTMQVLSRRTKNNPLLIGDPGVGKTAIAEGLAIRITQGDVPDSLKGKQLLTVDMGSLVAGTKFRGEFEERIKGLLREVEKSEGNILLFIDEVHTLVGAGGSEGAMDAANLLKPALARGYLHCIGATTLSEYQKHIEKDAALERRFQIVLVQEPSLEDAIGILRGLKERYEIYHGVHIREEALHAAVFLSDRYITDRNLPDKAIDLIDEGASMIRMQIGSLPLPIERKEKELSHAIIKQEALRKEASISSEEEIEKLSMQIAKIREDLAILKERWNQEKKAIEAVKEKKNKLEQMKFQEEEAERALDYNKVAEIRYQWIPELKKQIDAAQSSLEKLPGRLLKEEVDEQLIAHIVSKWTGIPVEKMLEGEADKLLHLEQNLGDLVIGQSFAIKAVSEAIRRSRAGLNDPSKPLGTFLFVGPTGVGKTELAKALALLLFNQEDALVRLDMSEYMEKHATAKLIGSPPGYVGYEEGGQLTEILRRRPYSVVLLDEIEKAHHDVQNMLLQVFDDGRLTDSKGRVVNCKNALFIMTSNLGSDLLLDKLQKKSDGCDKDTILQILEPALRSYFRPEFLNRIDDILPFLPLNQKEVEKIASLQLHKVQSRLEEKNIFLSWDSSVTDHLAEKGYDPLFGARPLKRLIQQEVVNLLSTLLLEGSLKGKEKIALHMDPKKGKILHTISK